MAEEFSAYKMAYLAQS